MQSVKNFWGRKENGDPESSWSSHNGTVKGSLRRRRPDLSIHSFFHSTKKGLTVNSVGLWVYQ